MLWNALKKKVSVDLQRLCHAFYVPHAMVQTYNAVYTQLYSALLHNT
jgi:hypothetical protein